MGVQIPKQLKQKTPARTIGLAKNEISFRKTLISLQESYRSLGTAPNITVRNEVAKVMFLHLSVILSTGGVCLSECRDTTPHRTRPPGPGTPPWDQTPRTRHHPHGARHPPGPDTPQTRHPPDQTPPPREQRRLLLRTVRILRILVLFF